MNNKFMKLSNLSLNELYNNYIYEAGLRGVCLSKRWMHQYHHRFDILKINFEITAYQSASL